MENKSKKSGLGIAALILGIVGLMLSCVLVGSIPCIMSLILGIIAIVKENQKKGLAIAGLVCSVVGLVFSFMGTMLMNGLFTNDDIGDDDSEYVDESVLLSQMDVVEYAYENPIGDTLYFLVVTNSSNLTVEIHANAVAKDVDGNLIGATDSEEVAVGSGETVCLCNYFDGVKDVASFEYSMSVKEDIIHTAIGNNLEVQEAKTSEKLILTCTNNGEEDISYINVYALFFKDGVLINYDSEYISDDREIKSGATLSVELDCRKEYDDVQYFVHGKGWK